MSLGTESVPFTMPVEPAGTANNNGNNNGWGGDGAWWIIVLFLFMWGNGGWGNGFGSGNNARMQGSLTRADLCAEMNYGQLADGIRGVQQGICDSTYALNNSINGLGMNVMQGFHGVDNAICNLGYQTQQGFNATQVAMMQGQNALQAQLAQCCCDNRAGQADIKYQMATDTCAIQNTIQNTMRDTIDNENRNHQALMNKLCQMEYNGLNDKYQAVMAENQALKFQISQSGQNNVIGARIDAATAEILRRTGNDCPVNAVVVQPSTPVQFPTNCCGQATFNGGWGNN